MTTLQEAAQRALTGLLKIQSHRLNIWDLDDDISALREAIASEPQAEPVEQPGAVGLSQILHDPENQPSQYGTVPLSWSVAKDLNDSESDAVRMEMARLLDGVALALRGDPGKLKRWSWHDLPDRAAAAIAAIDVMTRAAALATQPAAPGCEDKKDAERWRAMRELLVTIDWSFQGDGQPVAIFMCEATEVCAGPEGADLIADAAVAATQGAKT